MLQPRGDGRCCLFVDLYTLHITEIGKIISFYKKNGNCIIYYIPSVHNNINIVI